MSQQNARSTRLRVDVIGSSTIYGNNNHRLSAAPASGNSSFLPSIAGRPNIGSVSLSGIRQNKSCVSASSSNFAGGRKLMLKEILKIDWRASDIFKHYIIN
jgi:hypothetical protein